MERSKRLCQRFRAVLQHPGQLKLHNRFWPGRGEHILQAVRWKISKRIWRPDALRNGACGKSLVPVHSTVKLAVTFGGRARCASLNSIGGCVDTILFSQHCCSCFTTLLLLSEVINCISSLGKIRCAILHTHLAQILYVPLHAESGMLERAGTMVSNSPPRANQQRRKSMLEVNIVNHSRL